MQVQSVGQATRAVQPVQQPSSAEGATDGGSSAEPQSSEGVRVSLSQAGLERSSSSDKNSDIDDSDLPATIKQILKMIRELRAQIAAKQAELQALAKDQDVSAEQSQVRAQALQTELSSLSAALSSASANLTQAIREQSMSSAQLQTVAALSMG